MVVLGISQYHSWIYSNRDQTLVDIDDELLARARSAAGIGTIKATVEIALRRLANEETILGHVRRLRRRGALDIALVEKARASRLTGKHD